MASTLLILSIYVLATMRVTRLFTDDTILDPVRIWVAKLYGPSSMFVYFMACPWCIGLWTSLIFSAGVIPLLGWQWWTMVPLSLACSQIVGMTAPLYRDDDEVDYEEVIDD